MSDSNGISFKDPLSPILALVFTIVGAFLTYLVGLVRIYRLIKNETTFC
jgi:uncharacterized integral membrane protein